MLQPKALPSGGKACLACCPLLNHLMALLRCVSGSKPVVSLPTKGRSFVASALHQDIEHVSMLIDCEPQIVQLAIDGEEHLIKMSFVTRLCPMLAQLVRILLAELLTPLADRLIGHDNPTLCQKLFHITIAQRKTTL